MYMRAYAHNCTIKNVRGPSLRQRTNYSFSLAAKVLKGASKAGSSTKLFKRRRSILL
jgi:hypothetical protein